MAENEDQSSGQTYRMGGMRLITFNIQNRPGESASHRQKRLDEIVSLLKDQAPDIVCLQECLIDDFEILKKHLVSINYLSPGKSHLSPGNAGFTPRDDGDRLGEGNPIFLLGSGWDMEAFHSFWLSATPDVPSRSWRSAHHRIASVMRIRSRGEPSRRLHVVNVHLDHRSALARRNSLELIRQELGRRVESPADGLIVCGDFNIRPRGLRASGFVDRELSPGEDPPIIMLDAAKCHPSKRDLPTFRGTGPLGLFRGRLDYCLHSHNLECLDYEVVDAIKDGRWLSDHRLVRADFA